MDELKLTEYTSQDAVLIMETIREIGEYLEEDCIELLKRLRITFDDGQHYPYLTGYIKQRN